LRVDDTDVKRKMNMVMEKINSEINSIKPSPSPIRATPLQGRGIHTFPFAIAYADTDAGGIVYHARYIEIAERARMNWLKSGMPPPGGDIGFVISELSVKYKKTLRVADEFAVETRVTGAGAVTLDIEQKFVKSGEIYAILTGKAAYLDANMKPKRIPEWWKKYF